MAPPATEDEEGPDRGNGAPSFYRLNSNQSRTSIFENVEMAQDELFSGPVAESLPTSISAFAHHRRRKDSIASFSYYNEEDDNTGLIDVDDGRRSSMDPGDFPVFDGASDDEDVDALEEGRLSEDYVLQRRQSGVSITSATARLLRSDSMATATSGRVFGGRTSQKVYLPNEDMTIVVAGFRDSVPALWAYRFLCVSTFGLFYLLLRWLPRWYIRFVGKTCALGECDWAVIENQWGELVVLGIEARPYGRVLSSVFGLSEKMPPWALDEEPDPVLTQLRVIDYRYVRLYFHPMRDKFVVFSGWKDPNWTDVLSVRAGIDSDEKSARERLFGRNLIDMEQKSIPQLLVDEVLHPFYMFQLASLVLWSLDEYYAYAACIFIMSVGSITTTLIDTRTTMRRLREMSRFECNVRIIRNGFWRYVSSSDLVPGDVYEVSDPHLTQFPSDSILLSGDCIVNESMLTGESVPVSKIPATNETLRAMDLTASSVSPETARHFLFCGTKIIRARRPHDDRNGEAVVLALVVRTGFSTTNGSLVRSMLFPKPSGFKFYRDSFRYISVMALIAVLGFTASLINFIHLGVAWKLVIVRALDLITIAVPPALPVTLTIGTNFALSRLRKKNIYCISPQRVNVGGKLDLMCFDKTGTLTEEGLDVLGVRVTLRHLNRFSDVLSDTNSLVGDSTLAVQGLDTTRAALFAMATCHSLRLVDGELIGDPLDLKMFEFTGWSFQEGGQHGSGSGGGSNENSVDDQGGLSPSIARSPMDSRLGSGPVELGVLRSFEFVSQLRRASVLVRQFGQQSGDIYVKGAPECMRDICRPESFPSDYDELLAYYTHKGYRVIGCATRHIPKLSWVRAQKMKRTDVERDLDFIGFIIFENKLKPSTAGVLNELLRSNIGTVMVTGDNILTAISVARECELIDPMAHCFIPHFVQGHSKDPNARLEWESIDNTVLKLDSNTLLPLPHPAEYDVSLPFEVSKVKNYCLAVSGDVFRWIVDFAPPTVLQRMLVRGRVFARMSPDEKHELVEKLQSIGYCCGFCGDGANDCGALKVADVGISLSEAEASVAAPFTSRVFDISCVPEVIREGRAALVTSFSCFKYMSLYSAIQFTTVSFLYASVSNLGDFQFLFIDIILILPIAVFMSSSAPYPVLSRKSPTANLVSRKVLVPLLGHMVICIAIQAIAFVAVRAQPWFIPPKLKHDSPNIKNSENTALFLVSCFEYILAGVVLNAGPPFRERVTKNWPFVANIVIALLINAYMVLGPMHWLKRLMELTKMSWGFSMALIGLGALYIATSCLCEKMVFKKLAHLVGQVQQRVTGRTKQRKEYKLIAEDMRI